MTEVEAQLAVKAVYPNACSAMQQKRGKSASGMMLTLYHYVILPAPSANTSVKPLAKGSTRLEAWTRAAKAVAKAPAPPAANKREPKIR